LPLPESSKRKFLFIGRNEKRKGLDDLKSISKEIESLPIEFHFVGPIPNSKRLAAANCVYHGEIKDLNRLQKIIDSCQILVSPSHSEGMPNVILEAMSRGLAIIATEVGAVPMMVSDSNGKLIKPQNRNLLLDAVNDLASITESNLLQMRQESINKVDENYRWSSIAEKNLMAIEKATFTHS